MNDRPSPLWHCPEALFTATCRTVNNPARDFSEVIRSIRKEDPRYASAAYYFLRQALEYSLKELNKRRRPGKSNHLSGHQLLEGIRLFAMEQYGPMARSVLAHWGIRECRDFGNIVFNLVDCKVLGKQDQESIEDFSKGYYFSDAFDKPFYPKRIKPTTKRPRLN